MSSEKTGEGIVSFDGALQGFLRYYSNLLKGKYFFIIFSVKRLIDKMIQAFLLTCC